MPVGHVVVQMQIGAADGGALDRDDDAFGPGSTGSGTFSTVTFRGPFEDGGSHLRTLPAGLNCQGPNPAPHAVSRRPMPRTLEPSTTVVADEDIDAFFELEDLWAVIVWNDDVTTFQTVIQAFVEIFGHTVERADKLAWQIHRTGKAVAAVRPKDEAEAAVHALHLRKISASLSRA